MCRGSRGSNLLRAISISDSSLQCDPVQSMLYVVVAIKGAHTINEARNIPVADASAIFDVVERVTDRMES
jgi:hypothetical protein